MRREENSDRRSTPAFRLRFGVAIVLLAAALRPAPSLAATPTCKAGEYLNGGSCATCPAGTWSKGATECKPHSVCDETHYRSAVGTAKADTKCRPLRFCTEAEYEIGSVRTEPYTDDKGTPETDDDTTGTVNVSNRICKRLTVCRPGQAVDTPATASSDRTCKACADGTFSDVSNAAECTAWRETCPSTHFQAREPTARRDRVCTVMPVCKPGQYVSRQPEMDETGGYYISNRRCGSCSRSYSTTSNAASCTPWTRCRGAQVLKKKGSRTSDQVCEGDPGDITPPGDPSSLTIVAGDNPSTELTAEWSDVLDSDTGSNVTRYVLAYRSGASAPATCAAATGVTLVDVNVSAGVTPGASISGLASGREYSFRVCSVDAAGNYSDGTTATWHTLGVSGISVALTWSDTGDVDLHYTRVTAGANDDCYFANCRNHNLDWGGPAGSSPYLDTDNTSGFGPEVTAVDSPADGLYKIWVHYYAGSKALTANVKVFIYGHLVDTADFPLDTGTRDHVIGWIKVVGGVPTLLHPGDAGAPS